MRTAKQLVPLTDLPRRACGATTKSRRAHQARAIPSSHSTRSRPLTRNSDSDSFAAAAAVRKLPIVAGRGAEMHTLVLDLRHHIEVDPGTAAAMSRAIAESQVRKLPLPETCSSVDTLLLQSRIGGTGGHDAGPLAGRPSR
jgi:hypothetical protein